MSVNVLKKLYNFSVYLVGVLVLVAALFATIVRIFLPDLGMYRSEVEAWVSNYMELPVAIHSMSTDWIGWTPHLQLDQIDLMDSTGTNPILLIGRAHISINILSSLLNRRIIPDELVVSGLSMTISRLENGSINIQGLEADNNSSDLEKNNELDKWLLSQSTIKIQNASIEWLDELHQQPPINLSDVNLQLQSSLDNLNIKGNSTLPAEYGRTMEFSMDIKGDLLSSGWSADVFLKASQIRPDNWYKQHWPDFLTLTEGFASIELWSSFEGAKLISLHGNLQASEFKVYSHDNQLAEIIDLDTDFNGHVDISDNWLFDIQHKTFITQNGQWPETGFSVIAANLKNPQARHFRVEFDYLKIEDISAVLIGLYPPIQGQLENSSGELVGGFIDFNAAAASDDRFSISTKFRDLTTGPREIDPMLSDLSGEITGSRNQGEIRFSNDQAKIIHISGEDIISLDGAIKWQKSQSAYHFSSDKFTLSNDDFVAESSWAIRRGEETHINLIASVTDSNIINFIHYLPYSSSFRARDWLNRTVRSGLLSKLQLSFEGNPSNFPFPDGDGHFNATADIKNINIKYSDRYPEITGLDASVNFEGREMSMDIQGGNIFDSRIDTATAYIPNMFVREKLLSLSGNINGKTQDLKNFVHESPLNNDKIVATVNESLQPSGTINMDLDMTVPIRNPDYSLKLDGKVTFTDTVIQSQNMDLTLSEISGDVSFTENSLTATDMTANYDNGPVTLDIKGTRSSNSDPATVVLSGTANPEFIHRQLNRFLPGLSHITEKITGELSGSTPWQASIVYNKDPVNGELLRKLSIKTDLIGMSINLPQPFSKKDYETFPLHFSKSLGKRSDDKITLNIGDIKSELIINADSGSRLTHLNITTDDISGKLTARPGINVTGHYDVIDIQKLLALFKTSQETHSRKAPVPVNININAKSLLYLGQNFTNISLHGESNQGDWNYSVESETVKGSIKIVKMQDESSHVLASLDYLKLTPNEGPGGSGFNPATLPTIFAQVNAFEYNHTDLGNLLLTALPTENGLLIEDIRFKKPHMQIQASGKWIKNRYTGSSSSFFINVHSDEFNEILETFDFDNNFISKAETKIIIDANWPGGPSEFSLAKLNGTINLDIERGHLLDIKPAAGRLFGLLSLQTLPRRMVLDFSDLFGQGMAFDSITGQFNVNEGNAYTDNLTMRGPSVKIDISGRAGLSAQDYDQTAVVTPQISDSLAVASGFLGPVGIGLGTVLYLAGNMFEPLQDSINSIMKVEYSIKGSWNDPVIERADEKKES